MSKIAPDHLGRQAFVYVRQSTQDQLLHNHESRRRQYALADRAQQLGWAEPVVIDDDLGRSGGGVARPGFERLLLAICEGRVGIVLAVEASRLARNGRDWHTLLEFCGLVGCLLADEDGRLRSAPAERPPAARHEGHHERDGAVDPAPALARGAAPEGAPGRALPQRRRGLCEGPARPDRQGPRSARARGDRAGVPEVRGVPEHPSGASLAAPGAGAAAERSRRPRTGGGSSGSCRSTTRFTAS